MSEKPTDKATEKKRRGLTFPTDPLAVMQMDEIDASVRRAENDRPNGVPEGASDTPSASSSHDTDHMASHMAGSMSDQQAGNTATQTESQSDSNTAGGVAAQPYAQQALQPVGDGPSPPPTPPAGPATNAAVAVVPQTERDSRLSKAMQVIEENDLVNITVRIPAKFNGFLDEYVDRLTRTNPKRRYKKQDAIAEALALFIADHPMPAMPATQDDF